jgi:hypothetical protein
MVTGVEIAGLVLGAMPLVIRALESYRKGLNPLLDYFHYNTTLTKLRIRLNIQHVLFEDHLKRLLLSESSPAEIEALFYDPNEPSRIALWGSKEVEQKLRKKLSQQQFKTFMDVLQEMDGVMKKLMDNLDIDMKGKVRKLIPRFTKTMISPICKLTLLCSLNGHLFSPRSLLHLRRRAAFELIGNGEESAGASAKGNEKS